MKTQWYKVTVADVDGNVRVFALRCRDELAALHTVHGWLRVARQSGKTNRVYSRFQVETCSEPSSLKEDGTQRTGELDTDATKVETAQ